MVRPKRAINLKMILNYLRLTRPLNLAMVALFMWVLHRFIVYPIYGTTYQLWDVGEYVAMSNTITENAPLESGWVWLLILATVLITAAGNVINDVYDIEADKINKPNKVIVGEIVPVKSALMLFAALATTGTLLGLFCAWKAFAMQYAIVFPAALILLWAYARYFQKWFLVGNLVVALLAGLVPMTIWMFTLAHPRVSVEKYAGSVEYQTNKYFLIMLGLMALFAFMGTMLRELMKDLADVEGDKAIGSNTIPISLGAKATKWIISILTAVTMSVMIYAHTFTFPIVLIYTCLFILGPLVVSLVIMWMGDDRRKYNLASNMIKVSMLFVILLPIVYNSTIVIE